MLYVFDYGAATLNPASQLSYLDVQIFSKKTFAAAQVRHITEVPFGYKSRARDNFGSSDTIGNITGFIE